MKDSGIDEDLQVVGDGRLAETDGFGEIADARFLLLVRGDEGDQAQPSRIGYCLEDAREILSVIEAQRRDGQRRAAVVRLYRRGRGLCGHSSIMPMH